MQNKTVVYLVPDLIGPPSGIGRYCRMVCRSLVESGMDVTVVSLLDQPEAVSEAEKMFPGASYYPCQGSRVRLVQQAFWAVLRKRPVVVLAGHPNFSFLTYLLSRICRAKFVAFMYGTDVWKLLKPLRRRALCRADLSLSISQFTAKRATKANGVPANRIRILPNCLDTQFENKGDSVTTDETSPSILTVSRISWFEPYKGQEYVIRAMPSLLEQFPDLVYHIVGDGDRRPSLEKLAADEGVAHAVRFHGVVSDEVLAELYRNTTAFVMPSLVEGFGFVFLEAMAQGTPAIGGNRDAAPEVIIDGETGYVVDPTSVPEIAEAIARLLRDPALKQKMGEQGIILAKEKFSFPAFKQSLCSYLSEIVPEAVEVK